MKVFTNSNDFEKDLRKELRSIDKNSVLFYACECPDGSVLYVKACKSCILQLCKERDGKRIQSGSLWDITQKQIIEECKEAFNYGI